MALVKEQLQADIKAALASQIPPLNDAKVKAAIDDSHTKLAKNLADAIDRYIRTATVNVAPGIPVATTGGAGATAGPGSGTLS